MKRFSILIYGVLSYVIFLVAFLYAIGFVGNLVVPKSIDSGMTGAFGVSLLINAVLLGLFAVQHSVMARKSFKDWWTKIVPWPAERSTYVLLSSLILLLLFWQWRPMTGMIWDAQGTIGEPILWGVFALGWLVVLLSTFMIDHFELFGLKQVYCRFKGRKFEFPGFAVPFLYKYVRHPIMLGFIIAFWATPTMTVGHLFFAVATTAYIIIGVSLEESSLVAAFGKKYSQYRKEVPMLIPVPWRKYKGS